MLGADVTPYRVHAYRVANLCLVHSPGRAEALERIAIAAAFHDLCRVINMSNNEESPVETWMGWSSGKWEGDTLVVVDITNFNDQT